MVIHPTTHIVIPVRDQIDLTKEIVRELLDEDGWDEAVFMDNGSTDGTWEYLCAMCIQDSRIQPVDCQGENIYAMWEAGITAYNTAPANVIVINNDVMLDVNTFTILAEALRSDERYWIAYPNYDREVGEGYDPGGGLRVTSGTYRHGGMSGFCFMVKAEYFDWEPLIDPQFQWWGGDDDLAFEVERRGGLQVRVEGLPVWHMNEGTARHHDLDFTKAEDMQRVISKWGR